ncbi:hypothetical protein FRX31_023398 [Thalictrum thalictroides]|uniref:Uncharacterized protein n=1 Tax=Thalictrum thalictroides TaxID=46969 RepID=A0A7J6VPI8_THATH|nr:hypothetical protein FRX31_023398 [Thalictrum thalictroides]
MIGPRRPNRIMASQGLNENGDEATDIIENGVDETIVIIGGVSGGGVVNVDEDVTSPVDVDNEPEILPIISSETQYICSDNHMVPPQKGKIFIHRLGWNFIIKEERPASWLDLQQPLNLTKN